MKELRMREKRDGLFGGERSGGCVGKGQGRQAERQEKQNEICFVLARHDTCRPLFACVYFARFVLNVCHNNTANLFADNDYLHFF